MTFACGSALSLLPPPVKESCVCAGDPVHPNEGTGQVTGVNAVVVVVEAGATVAWDPAARGEGEVVAGVALDCLEGAEDEVEVECGEVRCDD